MKKYFLSDIENIGINIIDIFNNDSERYFNCVSNIENTVENSLIWIKSKEDSASIINSTLASFVVVNSGMDLSEITNKNSIIIIVDNPKNAFSNIVNALFVKKMETGIHQSSFVDKEAIIGECVHIGPNCYIGKCFIGKDSVVMSNVVINDNTTIMENVFINSGAIIGSEGFGYSRDENGKLVKFPHIGGVIIESNVDIGANTCIDRGSLGNTIIKQGSKIDNLVHIAHNVVVGEDTMVIANSMVGGSVEIGDHTWIAPSVSIINQVSIGSNVTIGMNAVVTKNVPDNETWTGLPAKEMKEFIAIQKFIKNSIK